MAHGVYRQIQKRGVNYFTSIQGSMDEPLRQVLMRDFAVIVPEVFSWHQRIRDGRRDGLKAYLQGAADFFCSRPSFLGETTGGGANRVSWGGTGHCIVIAMPTSHTANFVTRTNWRTSA